MKFLKIYLTVILFSFINFIQAQVSTTWDLGGNNNQPSIGFEKIGLTTDNDIQVITHDITRATFTKGGRLGLGKTTPEALLELNYCPNNNIAQNGLIVTHNECNLGVLPIDPNGGDRVGGVKFVKPGDGDPGEENPSVFILPFSFQTGNSSPIGFAPNNQHTAGPLLWLRKENPKGVWSGGSPATNDTKLIVMPDGSCGINLLEPRAALYVRGSNLINHPAAIFGSRAMGTHQIDPKTGLLRYYTQQVHFVPVLGENGYNQIVQAKDQGMFFTDGLGKKGANKKSAFVIAPWVQNGDSTIGGIRIDALGNIEVHGTLRATKLNLDQRWWGDFVFAENYKLRSIAEVDSFIQENKHLPDVPSEEEVKENGLNVGDMQAIQQQKIEELMLYIIQLQKQLEVLQKKVLVLDDE